MTAGVALTAWLFWIALSRRARRRRDAVERERKRMLIQMGEL